MNGTNKLQSLGDVLFECQKQLALQEIDSPMISAQLLLAEALNMSRLQVLLDKDRLLSAVELQNINQLLARRKRGEPLAYITGRKEFYSLNFKVDPNGLIPRPESELIIDKAQDLFSTKDSLIFADIGTGTGNLAVTLAASFPRSIGIATDISLQALQLAKSNIQAHGLGHRLYLLCAHLGAALKEYFFDLIVSNPPYLSENNYNQLSPEVRLFEPRLALHGGEQGYEKTLQMLKDLHRLLRPGGWFFLEINPEHSQLLLDYLQKNARVWQKPGLEKDFCRKNRLLMARRL